MNKAADMYYDIAIIGGACVGGTLACALAQAGLQVAVIEAREPQPVWPAGSVDLRVFAITRASERIFRSIECWDAIERGGVSPFREMRVWDASGPGAIHFDCAELGEPTLGYIIEQRVIQAALNARMEMLPTLTRLCPAELGAFELGGDAMRITLADGRVVRARLLVGADGAASRVRGMADIAVELRDYQQEAVVAVVTTEQSHQETAWQRFLPTGPLAFLPLRDGRSSIVWSTTPQQAAELCALDANEFLERLSAAFDQRLGRVIAVEERARFPLRRLHAKHYIAERLALVGDAAHVIHPLAGQGVNLGLLDAASLAEVVLDARATGRDYGLHTNLRRYERWRQGDNSAMQRAMDGFKGVFGSSAPPLRLLRNSALTLVDRLAPVKRLFASHAMGLSGDLPALARR
ncbi:MAG: UbiH/UbiF/VisC/COQ6 family ubiquinone biosynthesis hydroxylase [Gammaproteobacteria bacterium]|nr:UbiH/UbiF/VisC/COQ6 family ubiquinone biosynthesis hydroxylase [Gammaproteobacteria bacterium]